MTNNLVTLRPIEKDDLDLLFKWRNDENIFSQLGGGYFPTSKTEMSKWMDNFSKSDRTNIKFIVQYKEIGVGFISLSNTNYINKTSELGIYIGEKNYQGKGIASNALKLIEKFSKDYLNLRKIKLLVNNNNVAAIGLYEKNDYKVIGRYTKERYSKGSYIDVLIMEKFL